jgi:malate permease and related proteins
MNQVNNVFLLTLGIITMGYLLRKYNYINHTESKTISKFLMHTTFPALMLKSTINLDLMPELFYITLLCLTISGLGIVLAWFIFKRLPTAQRTVFTMAAGGINVGLFGFPLIEGIFGSQAMLYAVMFDLGNALMTFGVVYPVGSYLTNNGSESMSSNTFIKKIFAMPPFPAMLIGLAINMLNISVPAIVMSGIDVLSRANMALILLLLGIYLSFDFDMVQLKNMLKSFALKYTLGIIVVACLYFWLEPSLMRNTLICLSVLPFGMTILPFSDELNADSRLAGALANVTLLLSFALIWLLVLALRLA